MTTLLNCLKPHTLRRTRAEAGQTLNARTEIQIPVSFTDRQADYYRQVLGRFYNALVDPKMHRLSSSRASQAKSICEELRKVWRVIQGLRHLLASYLRRQSPSCQTYKENMPQQEPELV